MKKKVEWRRYWVLQSGEALKAGRTASDGHQESTCNEKAGTLNRTKRMAVPRVEHPNDPHRRSTWQ